MKTKFEQVVGFRAIFFSPIQTRFLRQAYGRHQRLSSAALQEGGLFRVATIS
jgi:hypothetical protein